MKTFFKLIGIFAMLCIVVASCVDIEHFSVSALDGVDGVDGKDGVDGQDGKDGRDGYSSLPHFDESTNTTIWYLDKNRDGDFTPLVDSILYQQTPTVNTFRLSMENQLILVNTFYISILYCSFQ